jgi:hypothetical protein
MKKQEPTQEEKQRSSKIFAATSDTDIFDLKFKGRSTHTHLLVFVIKKYIWQLAWTLRVIRQLAPGAHTRDREIPEGFQRERAQRVVWRYLQLVDWDRVFIGDLDT